MKNKLYFFLLTALMGLSGMNASAQDEYEIATAQDLADFAAAVNGGETSANAVLTADIDMSELESWTPIGINNDYGYKGTFDGQGKTITGFQLTSSTTNNSYGAGFFGHIADGANIQNFSIYGTITSTGQRMSVIGSAQGNVNISGIHSYLNITCTQTRHGGILGAQVGNGTINIDHCIFSGSLTTDNISGNFGGIVGLTLNNTNAYINITNCLFDGTIDIGTGDNAGGFVGYTRGCKLKIENCLSVGTITAANPGQFIGQINTTSNQKYSGINYYLGDNKTQGTGSATEAGPTPVKVTAAQLASGEIAFLLNESVSGGTDWYQTLNDDDYPFPFNGGYHDPIYANGSFKCDGVTPKEGSSVVYGNTNKSIIDDHDFVDGFCTVCGALDETWMTANGEGSFEIGTPIQLKWFAAYANQIDDAANAILTADIALTEAWTTPIGNSSVAFKGEFDGQGNKITNFEGTTDAAVGKFGLFGNINGATVKNFSIAGTLTVPDGASNGSGVVGWATSSTISNIYSTLVIVAGENGAKHVGGVVGSAQGGANTITNCTFAGSLTVGAGSHDCFAGIVGYISSDVVTNCLNLGTVDYYTENCYAGGIVGYINNANPTIANCLSIGAVTYKGEGSASYGGAIIGRHRKDAAKVQNNYWLEGSAKAASSDKVLTSPAATSVTAEQLASGEVTAKLGIAFRQNIGSDEAPVLDPTHNVVAKITEAGYATLFIPDTDLTIPAGVEANTGAILNEGWLHLNAIEGDAIAAGEPVVLKGNAGIYSFVPTTGAEKVAGNVLKGTAVDTEADGTMYVLAKPAEKEVGFYKATGTIPAGKAYLQSNAGVKAFFFDGDDATGIEETLSNSPLKGENVYNLAGQRMSKMHKGINIVDGKKILK